MRSGSALYGCSSCLYKHHWVAASTLATMVKCRVQGRIEILANGLVNLQLQVAGPVATYLLN